MSKLLTLLFSFLIITTLYGQYNFQAAYEQNPLVPKGLLEAVAHTQTRMRVIDQNTPLSCSGMPLPYGIMGLYENGANWFRENGSLISTISGISIEEQKSNPDNQILAYAKAFQSVISENSSDSESRGEAIYSTLKFISEIPDSGLVNKYALDAQIYEILKFLNDPQKANEYNFPVHNYNLPKIFGANNYKILSAENVVFSEQGIVNDKNEKYSFSQLKSTEYGPAIWNPAPSCNFSSRSGTAISAITIHTIQGTYAGAISWSQNCSSSVSYHYVIRSSDGQVTQMVNEADKAWHVGSENPYTIGYEHEGYVDNPVWYTEAMYNASADLSRDIVGSGYGIPALRTYYGASSSGTQIIGGCTKIKGHQHFPNQTHTDPGINWDWEKYYRLINNNPSITSISTTSGDLFDSGGSGGNYTDDERLLWLIEPAGATSITLNFTAFNIESGYDNLFIYDGNSIDAPIIGTYTGTSSPGTVISSGGSLLLEFRSDCGTVSTGWASNFTSVGESTDSEQPVSSVPVSDEWKTEDFTVVIDDTDNEGVVGRYYLLSDKEPDVVYWSANNSYGFMDESFNIADSWFEQTGTWDLQLEQYVFSNPSETNSNAYAYLTQNNFSAFLYEWDQEITSSESNQRAGLHFFCDDPTLPNRGNSYFVYFRETDQKAQIYKVSDDVFSLKTNDDCVVAPNTVYNYKVTYDPQSGWIKVYSDNLLVSQWQDIEPLQSGNSISLRSGGCSVSYDNIRVYRSRGTSVNVNVSETGTVRYQSVAANESGRIRVHSIDEAGNWSDPVSESYLIDWTAPELLSLNDGPSGDIDTTYIETLEANWSGTDIHSAIGYYEVAIGLLPSLNNVMNWTNVSLDEAFSYVLTSPIYNQVYSISLRMHNGAGLESLFVSDGQRLVDSTLTLTNNNLQNLSVYPNPVTEILSIDGINDELEIYFYDSNGKLILLKETSEAIDIDVSEWSQGIYSVVFRSANQFIIKKLVKN